MTAGAVPVTFSPLLGFPDVHDGDDIASLVLNSLQQHEIALIEGDILVVSSKVISKAMGLRAPAAEQTEVVSSQTVRTVAERMTPWGVTRIVESAAGPVMTAAGVDASNTSDLSAVLLLPNDPDAVAGQIRGDLQAGWRTFSGSDVRIGVILSDTAGRPWRHGQTDFALGSSGLQVVDDLRGSTDADGRILSVTERCIADEVAAAADLVKGKLSGIPVAHVRGLGQYIFRDDDESHRGARDLVRTGPGDWFAYGSHEAVRAALGAEPGSPEAAEVGIASISSETPQDKASRALRVALLECPEGSAHVDGEAIRLDAPDDFVLGLLTARALVALRGEGLRIESFTKSPSGVLIRLAEMAGPQLP
jgi:coenzyme F420-0:L-glutamate ligase/coenzyme F420-1:gamma-L-glutamate ligase